MKQIKVINRVPSPSDMIANDSERLFNKRFSDFLNFSFPVICCVGWGMILFAIFSS